MPPELWSILTSSGPVAAIMGFMWWLERKQRVEYQAKYEAVLAGLPDKLMGHAEERKESNDALIENFKKMARANWAAIKKVENPRRHISSPPPPERDDV